MLKSAPSIDVVVDGGASWLWISKSGGLTHHSVSQMLASITPCPLQLPEFCCRCGAKTSFQFPIKILGTRKERLMGLLAGFGGAAGHVASGVLELTAGKVRVPCCRDCRLIHRFGFLLGLVFLLAGLGLLFWLMYIGPEKLMRMSVAATLLYMLGGLSLIGIGVIVSGHISQIAIPVAICRRNDGQLYYEFRSKRFQQHLLDAFKIRPITLPQSLKR